MKSDYGKPASSGYGKAYADHWASVFKKQKPRAVDEEVARITAEANADVRAVIDEVASAPRVWRCPFDGRELNGPRDQRCPECGEIVSPERLEPGTPCS